MRLYGYVYKPGTTEQIKWCGVYRPFRLDETNCMMIKERGWDPKDVWAFDEKYGIIQPYFSPENPPTTEEIIKMKEIATKWNHQYIFGMGGDAPEYSLISGIYRHFGEEIRCFCHCVEDHKSQWYVACMSFPEKEVDEYWKKRRDAGDPIGYDDARDAFFDEKCPHHKKHGYPYKFNHIPNACKGVKKF